MARARMISRKIVDSIRVNNLPGQGALLFCYLIPHLDVQGVFWGSAKMVKAKVFARRPESARTVETYLKAMEESPLKNGFPLICRFYEGLDQYLCMPGFFTEQLGLRADREAPEFPAPPAHLMTLSPKDAHQNPAEIPPKSRKKPTEVEGEGEGKVEGEVEVEDKIEVEGEWNGNNRHLTPGDKGIIQVWMEVKGFRMSLVKCAELLWQIQVKYPGLDWLEESEKWRAYKLKKPLNAKANEAGQLWTWMNHAEQYRLERGTKAPSGTQGPGKRPGTDYSEAARRYATRIGRGE